MSYKVTIPDTVEYNAVFRVDYKVTVNGSNGGWYKGWREYRLTKPGDNVVVGETVNIRGRNYKVPDRHVIVKMDSKYEKEFMAARLFLATKGISTDTCNLLMEHQDEQTCLFCDRQRNLSILLANAKYHSTLKNPVLYWSKESSAQNIVENPTLKKLLNYYRNVLKEFEKNASFNETQAAQCKSYNAKSTVVAPILGKIRFNQTSPYNLLSPRINGKRALVGCVSVACGQAIAHYKYPNQGNGEYAYRTRDKKSVVKTDFTQVKFDYNTLADDYTSGCDSSKMYSISNLLTAISASLGAEFNSANTAASFSNIKPAMVNFWGYSNSCYMCQTNSTDTIVGLIYRELDEERPAIVSDHGHCFIADGREEDFIHFNMGWGGRWNGYYRFMISSSDSCRLPIISVMIDLKPDNGERLSLSINVKKPNTLRTLLSAEQQKNLTSLTLSGVLGNDDVVLLRQMLGAENMEDLFQWHGQLSELDLTDTKFQTDKKSFFNRRVLHGNAGSSWINTESATATTDVNGIIYEKTKTDVHYYNYDTMDPKSWSNFKLVGMHKRDGAEIKYSDGVCAEYEFVQSGIISPFMFASCQNLRKIRLPQNTTKVCYNAFLNCKSLTDIIFGDKVVLVENYALSYTMLLKDIKYTNRDVKFESSVAKNGNCIAKLRRISSVH